MNFKGMVLQVPKVHTSCSSCSVFLVGKQPGLAFNSSLLMRAKEVIVVVHSYLCEPLEVLSHSDNKCFITFVDGFSRMLWLFFTKAKNETMDIFKKFKVIMEMKSRKLVETLRTDNRGVYTSKNFESFYVR